MHRHSSREESHLPSRLHQHPPLAHWSPRICRQISPVASPARTTRTTLAATLHRGILSSSSSLWSAPHWAWTSKRHGKLWSGCRHVWAGRCGVRHARWSRTTAPGKPYYTIFLDAFWVVRVCQSAPPMNCCSHSGYLLRSHIRRGRARQISRGEGGRKVRKRANTPEPIIRIRVASLGVYVAYGVAWRRGEWSGSDYAREWTTPPHMLCSVYTMVRMCLWPWRME